MAKVSMVEREKKRAKLVKLYAPKRAALKDIVKDQSKPMEERFRASLKLAALPRNSSATRLHTRGGRRGWGCRRGGCSRFRSMHSVCAVLFTAHISLVARHDDHVHRHGGKQDEANNNFPHINSFWDGFVQSKGLPEAQGYGLYWCTTQAP